MASKELPETATPVENAELAPCNASVPATRTALAHVSWPELEHADRIAIEGLEVFANHGVYVEENTLGQKFVVSLVLYADLQPAGAHDDLSASIDYGEVAHRVERFVRTHTFKLIESVAEGVAADLLQAYPSLLGIRVRVEKPWAPIGLPLRTVSVEITRTR